MRVGRDPAGSTRNERERRVVLIEDRDRAVPQRQIRSRARRKVAVCCAAKGHERPRPGRSHPGSGSCDRGRKRPAVSAPPPGSIARCERSAESPAAPGSTWFRRRHESHRLKKGPSSAISTVPPMNSSRAMWRVGTVDGSLDSATRRTTTKGPSMRSGTVDRAQSGRNRGWSGCRHVAAVDLGRLGIRRLHPFHRGTAACRMTGDRKLLRSSLEEGLPARRTGVTAAPPACERAICRAIEPRRRLGSASASIWPRRVHELNEADREQDRATPMKTPANDPDRRRIAGLGGAAVSILESWSDRFGRSASIRGSRFPAAARGRSAGSKPVGDQLGRRSSPRSLASEFEPATPPPRNRCCRARWFAAVRPHGRSQIWLNVPGGFSDIRRANGTSAISDLLRRQRHRRRVPRSDRRTTRIDPRVSSPSSSG